MALTTIMARAAGTPSPIAGCGPAWTATRTGSMAADTTSPMMRRRMANSVSSWNGFWRRSSPVRTVPQEVCQEPSVGPPLSVNRLFRPALLQAGPLREMICQTKGVP